MNLFYLLSINPASPAREVKEFVMDIAAAAFLMTALFGLFMFAVYLIKKVSKKKKDNDEN